MTFPAWSTWYICLAYMYMYVHVGQWCLTASCMYWFELAKNWHWSAQTRDIQKNQLHMMNCDRNILNGFHRLHIFSVKLYFPHHYFFFLLIHVHVHVHVRMWCVLPKTDTFGQEIKTVLVIDNESRDIQLTMIAFLF